MEISKIIKSQNDIHVYFTTNELHNCVVSINEVGYITCSGEDYGFILTSSFKDSLINNLYGCTNFHYSSEALQRILDYDTRIIINSLKGIDFPILSEDHLSKFFPPSNKNKIKKLLEQMQNGSKSYDEVIEILQEIFDAFDN